MTTFTITDARRAGLCVAGLRAWCADNGIDMRDAIRNGITAERLIESGNAGLVEVLLAAREGEP